MQLHVDSSTGGTPAAAEKKETDFFAEHTQVGGSPRSLYCKTTPIMLIITLSFLLDSGAAALLD